MMDRCVPRCLIFTILAWFSFSACGLMMVTTAEPTVSAWIVTPEADRKEGGQVHMRCVATNLESDHRVEWRLRNNTLRWGTATVTNNPRFTFKTEQTNGETTQDFDITDLQRNDTGEYVCNVNYQTHFQGRERLVATVSVTLSVLYFPVESFPICSPNGPITVDTGTELILQCSSEIGNPVAMMKISKTKSCKNYTWTDIRVSMVFRSLDLTVDAADNDVAFKCEISSQFFPDMNRSCTIGPISVSEVAGSVTACPPEPEATTATSTATTLKTVPSNTTLIAAASIGGVAVLVLFLILIVVCRRRGLCSNTTPSSESDVKSNSNPTGDQFTPEHCNLSQPHVHENAGLEVHQNPRVYAHERYQGPNKTLTANPESQPSTAHSGAAPVTRTAERNNTPLYAEPHKGNATLGHDNEAKLQHPYQSHHASTEQRYSNVAFDFNDTEGTTEPLGDRRSAASLKPVAMVPPISKVPAKPKPYKPKAQSTPQDDAANQRERQISSRPQSTPLVPPTHLHAVTPNKAFVDSPSSGINTSPRPAQEDAPYALVSTPGSHNGSKRNPASDDHMVYAELDLQSIPSEDGNEPLSSADPVVYASVMK